MLHCFGGTGPYLVDYLTPLENWVEQGEKPAQLLAGFAGADGQPEGGRHQGGDDRDPPSFVCE